MFSTLTSTQEHNGIHFIPLTGNLLSIINIQIVKDNDRTENLQEVIPKRIISY